MIEEILSRLEKVRKSGNKYTACCPVHNDRSPSMTITEKDDRVLIYCFSCGAKGLDVVRAIGMSASSLFRDEWQKPEGLTPKQRDEMMQDRFVIEMRDQAQTYADYKRVKLAEQRLQYLEELEKSLKQ